MLLISVAYFQMAAHASDLFCEHISIVTLILILFVFFKNNFSQEIFIFNVFPLSVLCETSLPEPWGEGVVWLRVSNFTELPFGYFYAAQDACLVFSRAPIPLTHYFSWTVSFALSACYLFFLIWSQLEQSPLAVGPCSRRSQPCWIPPEFSMARFSCPFRPHHRTVPLMVLVKILPVRAADIRLAITLHNTWCLPLSVFSIQLLVCVLYLLTTEPKTTRSWDDWVFSDMFVLPGS